MSLVFMSSMLVFIVHAALPQMLWQEWEWCDGRHPQCDTLEETSSGKEASTEMKEENERKKVTFC